MPQYEYTFTLEHEEGKEKGVLALLRVGVLPLASEAGGSVVEEASTAEKKVVARKKPARKKAKK